MMRLAKNEIHFGHYISLEEIVAGLLQVTPAEIQEVAQNFLQPDLWALTLLGEVGPDWGGPLDF
jgi:predicted Zn-dependent peptidase